MLRRARLLLFRLLTRFGVLILDALPQPFQRISAAFRLQSIIGTQARNDSLNDLFSYAIDARFRFPIIEHLCKTADNGGIVISIPVFKTEKFSEFL